MKKLSDILGSNNDKLEINEDFMSKIKMKINDITHDDMATANGSVSISYVEFKIDEKMIKELENIDEIFKGIT